MPALLLRFLPHALVLAAIVLAGWWLRHQGYEAGARDVRAEWREAQEAANKATRERDARYRAETADLEAQLAEALARPERVRIEPRTLVREVVRDVETDCRCPAISSDFRLQWNAIAAGDAGPAAAGAVPDSASP